jgi:3-hydroxybutyryl-CoA dehydrogenase
VARSKLSPAEAQAALERIAPAQELEAALRGADFVIEAVPEDIALKLATFPRLDALCPPEVCWPPTPRPSP